MNHGVPSWRGMRMAPLRREERRKGKQWLTWPQVQLGLFFEELVLPQPRLLFLPLPVILLLPVLLRAQLRQRRQGTKQSEG